MVNNMQQYVVREPKKRELGYQRCFGKEKVVLGAQVFRKFVVSLPL